MPTPPTPPTGRRTRLCAARALASRRERRRQLTIGGVTIAVLALAAGIIAVAVTRHGAAHQSPPAREGQSTLPPWPTPAPGNVPALVAAAGLPLLRIEATDVHFHAHLNIVVNGQPVPVPANIGIGARALSPLHTHDATGIVHVEAPAAARFTLGQLFTEWNVVLTRSCVGGLCADRGHQLRFFTDGTPYTGDPTGLPLTAHEEIAIVYAAVGQSISPPSSFPFPAGL